ncbi:MAG: hypothetical protein KKG03_05445 [Gammaproteobacteria bacterium]|jgi:hypothetical protein|nr:hypothetical protein [Sideroxydans sp.]MBU3903914.1 hypothetical protein [Gammaproteobacteria bacterium]MBU4045220.1 hypothetical protein [Gammaproteobacteria bacterium]MBU4151080.1 hypothetical protein [Gammaproteobacteria bacterium]
MNLNTDYHAAMKKYLRQSIYVLMLTLVSNAVGWTFNSEAVADVWFEAQVNSSVVAELDSDEHADDKAVAHQGQCNHWCHAIGHFMGLTSQLAFVIPDYFGEYTVQLPVTVRSSSPDQLFRPPRASLA